MSFVLPTQRHTLMDCLRVGEDTVTDGGLDEAAWRRVRWSDPFVKRDTGGAVSLDSRIAFLRDDAFLDAAFRFEDHEIWGPHVEHHDPIYHRKSDAEIFVAGTARIADSG